MKRFFIPILLTVFFTAAGCTGDAANQTPEAQAEPVQMDPAPVMELTSEEEALLDTSAVIEDTEPITEDNYEQKLEELEEALNSEQ